MQKKPFNNWRNKKMIEGFRIVDAHCHPIDDNLERSKFNAYGSPACTKDFFDDMKNSGLDFCAGSVIRPEKEPESFAPFAETNASGFKLQEKYSDFYQVGIRINPLFVKESIAELEKYHKLGVNWVGELVPYMSGYTSVSTPECLEVLAAARDLGMVVNIHSPQTEDLEKLMKNLPDLKVVGAHPGERALVLERAELMKKYENLHWDISGTGLFRWGMLRYLVEQCGNDKLLFGTDYPICNIAMQVYGVLSEKISEEAKAAIFSGNFDRLTGRI